MWRWLKRGVAAALILASLWLALVWSEWLPRPSAAQREALAVMRAPMQQAVGEHNAYDFFWLFAYDLPEREWDRLMAEDRAQLSAPDVGATDSDLASAKLPRLLPKDAPPLTACGSEGNCLATVRADPEAVRAGLSLRQPLLDKLDGLARYDHVRATLPVTMTTPIPAFQDTGRLQVIRAALRHVDGQTDLALTGLCGDLQPWRRLKGRSDSLIFEMISLAWLRSGAQLYADIRSELPLDYPLPPSCHVTFAPLEPAQRQSCDVYRGEFALLQHALLNISPELVDSSASAATNAGKRHAYRVLVNPNATLALMAPGYQGVCARLNAPLGTPAEPSTAAPLGCRVDEWLFNPLGCELAEIAIPDFASYRLRDRDGEGQLRLVALADWLAGQPDPATAFAARPAQFQEFEQPVHFENGQLSIELLKPRDAKTPRWSIVLPGSRVARQSGSRASAVQAGPDTGNSR